MLKRSIAAILACTLAGGAYAASSACPQHYVQGNAPDILNQNMNRSTMELCYKAFGVRHSGITRTPLWSAERLTAANIESAKLIDRDDSFHADPNLPRNLRAELADYAKSGYDRGHLAPNADMPDRESQGQSFSLANMIPQDPDNNRHVWAGIEAVVRKMATKEGELFIISGPVFQGSEIRKVGNVLVPTHLYKVVYSPKQQMAAAYYLENAAKAQYEILTMAQLEARVGINLLPSLSPQQKQLMLVLPKPRQKN